MELTEILQAAIAQNASDIVLKDMMPPMFRIRGELTPYNGVPPLTVDTMQRAADAILSDDTRRMRFATERHADVAYDLPDVGRFRVNVFRQR
ncbi:MAG TPA: type IV pili twitching motility protein PilT, partial [Candidatus Kryptonia bacterium]|nr:type IV pili twitching motility protein PilT [Candidatus Kryptonia bacterium]